jgi:pimeloyl-ACP methyl ester carboxylesterase
MSPETVYFLAGATSDEPALLVRHVRGRGPSVLYVHGATFPSALSLNYRFTGGSWADDLAKRGYDVWSFDFAGYGGSDRPEVFSRPAGESPPYGRAAQAAAQIARVVAHICLRRHRSQVTLIAHSWGSQAAGLYASRAGSRVSRLVMFGPVVERRMAGLPSPDDVPAWRMVTVAEQLARFVEDVPMGRPSVLVEPSLRHWGPAWLATCPERGAGVKIPAGPQADIYAAWSGGLAYDPGRIRCPTLIIRGAWDGLCTDEDAAWLAARLGSLEVRDVVVPEATHLMHLEVGRAGLYVATAAFLRG